MTYIVILMSFEAFSSINYALTEKEVYIITSFRNLLTFHNSCYIIQARYILFY